METKHCTHCGDEATQRCSTCKIARYCSKECQLADWKWHKLLCKESAAFAEKPDTDQEVRRVILLREGSKKPEFYWIPVKVEEGEDEDELEEDIEFASDLGVPDRDTKSGSIMPADDDACGMGKDMPQFVALVVGSKGHGELLDHSLNMMCKESFFHLPPNNCLKSLLGAKIADAFRGPILLLSMTKVENSSRTLDIEASDFTLALDGLVEFSKMQGSGNLDYWAEGGPLPKKVVGVQVNASMPYFEEIKVLRSNRAFTSEGRLSALSGKLGLSLRTSTPTGPVEADGSGEAEAEDSAARIVTHLHLCIDPTSADFGSIPKKARKPSQSTLIVSADKNDVTISDVVTMCDFIKDDAKSVLAQAKKLSAEERQAAVNTMVKMWEERSGSEDSDDDSEDDEGGEEEGGYVDGGAFDDLADLQAKMGSMQMTTATGAGYI